MSEINEYELENFKIYTLQKFFYDFRNNEAIPKLVEDFDKGIKNIIRLGIQNIRPYFRDHKNFHNEVVIFMNHENYEKLEITFEIEPYVLNNTLNSFKIYGIQIILSLDISNDEIYFYSKNRKRMFEIAYYNQNLRIFNTNSDQFTIPKKEIETNNLLMLSDEELELILSRRKVLGVI